MRRKFSEERVKVAPELQKWFDTEGKRLLGEFMKRMIEESGNKRLEREEDNRVKTKKQKIHVPRLQSPITPMKITDLPLEDQIRIMNYPKPKIYKEEALNILSTQHKPGRVGVRR